MYKSIVLCDGVSKEYLQEITNFIKDWMSDSPTMEVKTSGSTGKPKIILLDKERVKASALATGRFFGFKAGQKILMNLPVHYIAGKLMLVRALTHDMEIVVAPARENPLETLTPKEASVDFGAFVPHQVSAMLQTAEGRQKYEAIRYVIIGGAPVTPVLAESLQGLTNQTFETFGMTETITHFALKNVSRAERWFTCLPGFEIELGEQDNLIINPNSITDRLETNDRIEWLNKTQFIWKGRTDFVINSGGIKISPEELEATIAHLIPDNRFYLTGRKNERWGEELVLCVEGKAAEFDDLVATIATVLPKHYRPKAILFSTAFETTRTGKIIRRKY